MDCHCSRSIWRANHLPLPYHIMTRCGSTINPATPISSRRQTSDSDDSEYGARFKKKRRPAADEVCSLSRTGKMPHYNDDVNDFDQFDDPDPGYYYVDAA